MKKRVVLGVTGSVAAVKLTQLLENIEVCGIVAGTALCKVEVKIVLTESSLGFISPEAREILRCYFLRSVESCGTAAGERENSDIVPLFLGQSHKDLHRSAHQTRNLRKEPLRRKLLLSGVYTDREEGTLWTEQNKVLHISLKSWADVFLIAPLDANTMAKIVHGMADNLLTCVARAWPVGRKPFLVAPAMNTDMYVHPLTRSHLSTLANVLGATCIEPVEKLLACGDRGIGAMAHVDTIAECLWNSLRHEHQCHKERVNDDL